MAKKYNIIGDNLTIILNIPQLAIKNMEFRKIIDLNKNNVWYKEDYHKNRNYLTVFNNSLKNKKYQNCDLVSSLKRNYQNESWPLKNLDSVVNGNILEKMKQKEFFCEFRLEKNLSNLEGVYLWVVDKKIIYVGEAKDLKKRFNYGYGHISPRNVFVGGQSTNCKMNLIVSSFIKENKTISIYFYDTRKIDRNFKDKKYKSSREFIEKELIDLLKEEGLCNKQL